MRQTLARWIVYCLLCLPGLALAQTALINGNRIITGWLNFCDATGSSGDAYACNLNPPITAYFTGTRYFFKASANNVGAATLNLNGLGAIPIVKAVGGVPTTLSDNDIRANQYVEVVYDATGPTMQILSQLGTLPTGGTGVIATGQLALATSAIPSGQCATAQTATATGTTTSDVVAWSFASDPTGVTGYTAATTGTLRVDAYPTSNAIGVRVCNATAASISPGSVSVNWRVLSSGGMVASGTLALGTSTVNSGTCTAAQTATATGALTTDLLSTSFNADISSVAGYTPATTGSLRVEAYLTANTINVKQCNSSAGNLTPGAATLNFRVVR